MSCLVVYTATFSPLVLWLQTLSCVTHCSQTAHNSKKGRKLYNIFDGERCHDPPDLLIAVTLESDVMTTTILRISSFQGGVILLDSNGESCDGDHSEGDELEPVECSNNFVFVGAEIKTGKSSIRSKLSKRKVSVSCERVSAASVAWLLAAVCLHCPYKDIGMNLTGSVDRSTVCNL